MSVHIDKVDGEITAIHLFREDAKELLGLISALNFGYVLNAKEVVANSKLFSILFKEAENV